MRKRIIQQIQPHGSLPGEDDWLKVEDLAEVEVTSEDTARPIESALLPNHGPGWRAAEPGQQTVRLIFTRPQQVRRILLNFLEPAAERMQEYVLRWSPNGGRSVQEIVRQQWNFSPEGAAAEREDYRVALTEVTILEFKHHSGYHRRSCVCFYGTVAACLSMPRNQVVAERPLLGG